MLEILNTCLVSPIMTNGETSITGSFLWKEGVLYHKQEVTNAGVVNLQCDVAS